MIAAHATYNSTTSNTYKMQNNERTIGYADHTRITGILCSLMIIDHTIYMSKRNLKSKGGTRRKLKISNFLWVLGHLDPPLRDKMFAPLPLISFSLRFQVSP